MRAFLQISLVLFMLTLVGGCMGGGDAATSASPDVPQKPAPQQIQSSGTTEISIGMDSSQVNKLLGPTDSTRIDEKSREIWVYERKSAAYVFAGNSGRTLILDKYSPNNSGQYPPINLTIIFGPGRKVTDFSYQQLRF